MQCLRKLTAFEQSMMIGARHMRISIEAEIQEFGFTRSTVSRVFHEWLNEGVTVHNRQHTGHPATLDDHDRRHMRQIVNSDRRVTVQQIMAQFNVGHARNVSQWTIHRNMDSMGYGSWCLTRVPLLT